MSEPPSTYLDHGATTPLRPEVAHAMAEARSEPLGNPTGSHRPAQRARRLLEEARDEVAAPARARSRRDRLHLGRHRVGQPGRLRRPGDAVRRRAVRRGAVLRGGAPRGARVVPGRGAVAGRDLGRAPRRRHRVGRRRRAGRAAQCGDGTGRGHARQQRDRRGPAAAPGGRRGPRAGRRRPGLHRRGAGGLLLDLAETTAAADLVALSAHKVGGPVGAGALAVRPPTDIAPDQSRRGPGARAAQRHPGRGRCGGVGRRAASRRRARGPRRCGG